MKSPHEPSSLRSRYNEAKRRARERLKVRPRENLRVISKDSLRVLHAQNWNTANAIRVMTEVRLGMIEIANQTFGDYFLAQSRDRTWNAEKERWLRKQLSALERRKKVLLSRQASMKRLEEKSLEQLRKLKSDDFREMTDDFADFKEAMGNVLKMQKKFHDAKKIFEELQRGKKITRKDQKEFYEVYLKVALILRDFLEKTWTSYKIHGVVFSHLSKSAVRVELRDINKTIRLMRAKINQIDEGDGPPLAFI